MDGDPKTAWTTQRYRGALPKPGVGLILDLGRPVRARRLALLTSTPGAAVEIYAARGGPPPRLPAPGWERVASRTVLPRTATISLRPAPARFLLVWIVRLPPHRAAAAIDEATVRR